MNTYFSNTITTKINIPPKSLNKDINKSILKNLRKELEGKCIKDGYIKKNSISVVNKGLGRIEKGQFNGNIIYDIEYQAEVYAILLKGKFYNVKPSVSIKLE